MTADVAGRHLYLCTPDRPDLERFVEACVRGGVDIVQLRDKNLPDGLLVDRARALVAVCRAVGVPAIVNDRPDVAVEADADGVHVGQDDVAPEVARSVVGVDRIVGLSTHAPDELQASLARPVDYISAGPVVPTPTKPGRPGTGTGYLRMAVGRSPRPVFVTGGVTPETVGSLVAAGARHVVVVRYLTGAVDPEAAARRLRRALDAALATAPGGGAPPAP